MIFAASFLIKPGRVPDGPRFSDPPQKRTEGAGQEAGRAAPPCAAARVALPPPAVPRGAESEVPQSQRRSRLFSCVTTAPPGSVRVRTWRLTRHEFQSSSVVAF